MELLAENQNLEQLKQYFLELKQTDYSDLQLMCIILSLLRLKSIKKIIKEVLKNIRGG